MKKLSTAQKGSPRFGEAGFTLIELLVVIGILAVLLSIVLVAINPARQFAQGRDTQRTSNLNSILNAVGQRMADNKGVFAGSFTINLVTYTCPTIPTAIDGVDSAAGGTGVDLSCLVPTYIPTLPSDPSGGLTAPDTGYQIYVESATGRVHVVAPVLEPSIPRDTPMTIIR